MNPDWYVSSSQALRSGISRRKRDAPRRHGYLPAPVQAHIAPSQVQAHHRAHVPLFPRIPFTPARTLNLSASPTAMASPGTDPIIADQFGRLCRSSMPLIAKIRGNEECGAFDDLSGKHRSARAENRSRSPTPPLMEGVIKSVRSLENVRLLAACSTRKSRQPSLLANCEKAS